jgi:hypothetical protein
MKSEIITGNTEVATYIPREAALITHAVSHVAPGGDGVAVDCVLNGKFDNRQSSLKHHEAVFLRRNWLGQ